MTRRVRRKLQTQIVSHSVAERKHWAKWVTTNPHDWWN